MISCTVTIEVQQRRCYFKWACWFREICLTCAFDVEDSKSKLSLLIAASLIHGLIAQSFWLFCLQKGQRIV